MASYEAFLFLNSHLCQFQYKTMQGQHLGRWIL